MKYGKNVRLPLLTLCYKKILISNSFILSSCLALSDGRQLLCCTYLWRDILHNDLRQVSTSSLREAQALNPAAHRTWTLSMATQVSLGVNFPLFEPSDKITARQPLECSQRFQEAKPRFLTERMHEVICICCFKLLAKSWSNSLLY
jgi:hypothetical protein